MAVMTKKQENYILGRASSMFVMGGGSEAAGFIAGAYLSLRSYASHAYQQAYPHVTPLIHLFANNPLLFTVIAAGGVTVGTSVAVKGVSMKNRIVKEEQDPEVREYLSIHNRLRSSPLRTIGKNLACVAIGIGTGEMFVQAFGTQSHAVSTGSLTIVAVSAGAFAASHLQLNGDIRITLGSLRRGSAAKRQ